MSGSKQFDTLKMFLIFFLKKVILKKKSADDTKSIKKYRACKELYLQVVQLEEACIL